MICAPKRPLTARSAAGLVLRRAEERDAEEAERLNRLRGRPGTLAEAIALAEGFATLVRTRDLKGLEPCITRAPDSAIWAFQTFAKKLDADLEAVRAALSLPWSHGAGGGSDQSTQDAQTPNVRPRQP